MRARSPEARVAAWCAGMTVAAALAWAQEPAATANRTWTSVTGSTIDAQLVRIVVDQVILRKTDGSEVKIALNRLSREDQIWAQANRPDVGRPAPAAADAPPTALEKLFGRKLTNAGKDRVATASLTSKRIGIYFSAHWCPPCRKFTPQLVDAYQQLKKDGKSFEVVFVSRDRDEAAMIGYMRELDMPWLAIPFDGDQRDELCEKFDVSGIPRLVIIDDDGEVIAGDARGQVAANGAEAYRNW